MSENGDAVFPISLVHLIETSTVGDDRKREEFLEFMFRVSRGYAIVPFVRIINFEIYQAVLKQVGLPTIDLKEVVVGKGLPFILGAKPEIVKRHKDSRDIPEDLRKTLLEKVESPQTLLLCMKNKRVVEEARKGRDKELRILEELETIRSEDEKIRDKDLRRRINIVKYFRSLIVPEMAGTTLRLGLHPKFVMPESTTREEVDTLFQNMPTAYTLWVLTWRRDVQRHRKIDKNDMNDIAALSMAIPYCDIVVTEKMWSSIALQAKLDKLYDTIILPSVRAVHKHLA